MKNLRRFRTLEEYNSVKDNLSGPTISIIDEESPNKAIYDSSYIKDGLIFLLDGTDKGSDPDAWTDLVGGVRFPYVTDTEATAKGVKIKTKALVITVSHNHHLK